MTQREQHKADIEKIKKEISTAGPCHKRDLIRQLHRMQKELKIFDIYHQLAQQGGDYNCTTNKGVRQKAVY